MHLQMDTHLGKRESTDDDEYRPNLDTTSTMTNRRRIAPMIPAKIAGHRRMTMLGHHQMTMPQVPKSEPPESPVTRDSLSNGSSVDDSSILAWQRGQKRKAPSRSAAEAALSEGDEEYRAKRDRNNEAVKKSRAKAKKRQEEIEKNYEKLMREHESLQKRCKELEAELDLEKKKNFYYEKFKELHGGKLLVEGGRTLESDMSSDE